MNSASFVYTLKIGKLTFQNKTFFIFYGLIFLFIFPLYAQFRLETPGRLDHARIVVNYQLTFRPDTNDLENTRHERMVLLIGNELSLFASYNRKRSDTAKMNLDLNADISQVVASTVALASRIPTRFSFYVIKDYKNNKIIYEDGLFMGNYYYTESLNAMEWEITDRTDTYKGFDIQKATTHFGGRAWEAWFSPQIPIADGPFTFNGLPGLILKISDSEKHYVFSVESINEVKEKRPIARLRRDQIRVSKEDFFTIRQNDVRNFAAQKAEWGNPPEAIRLFEENMRRSNNPIMLRAE